jgi:hypothetical protein
MAGRRNERIQIGKKVVKLSLFADDMILYQKDLKNSTRTIVLKRVKKIEKCNFL